MRQGMLLLVALAGCGLAHPTEGKLLAAGVGLATFEVRTNGTDVVSVDVVYPADDAGKATGSGHPAVVFVQGGLVRAEQYRWQAELLASRGYVVALPRHLFDLAFFEVDNGRAAQALLLAPPKGSLLEGLVDPGQVAVAGHSLGGVVAVKLALEGGYRALVVEASYADSGDDGSLPKLGLPTLSVVGTKDCKLDQVKAGWAAFPSPTALVVLSGISHYQFTADQSPDTCTGEGTLESAHQRIGAALTNFLGTALAGQPLDATGLGAISGAEVETR